MNYRWLIPLRLGTAIGVVIGCVTGVRAIQPYRYLPHHLYNLAMREIAYWVNLDVIVAIAAAYLLFAIYVVASRGERTKKSTNAPALGVALLLMCVAGFHRAAQAGTLQDVTAPSAWLPAVEAIACIASGFVVMWLIRNRPGTFARTIPAVRCFVLFTARLFIPCLVVLLAVNTCSFMLRVRAASTVKDRPNVIFIMVDTLRADHLGCYGYKLHTSPNIDAFAGQSYRFSRAISQAPLTRWSVPSFMTSQYPQDILNKDNQISGTQLTLAETLRDVGYTTSAVISNENLLPEEGLAKDFDHYDISTVGGDTSSPGVLSQSREQIHRLKGGRFFLFCLFMDPHSPYTLHDQYDFSSPYKGERSRVIDVGSIPVFRPGIPPSKPLTERDKDLAHVYYDSEIRFTDDHIGMLLKELKKQGLYDNSLIIFLGDHGEELRDHGKFFHGSTLYHEVLDVPLLIKLPRQRTGEVVQGSASLLQVFPTIMQTLQYDPSHLELQGSPINLTHNLRLPDTLIFGANTYHLLSAASDIYKFILHQNDDSLELYNTRRDPAEKMNIAGSEPDGCRVMRKAILDRESLGKRIRAGQSHQDEGTPMTDQEKERLRDLGYLAN